MLCGAIKGHTTTLPRYRATTPPHHHTTTLPGSQTESEYVGSHTGRGLRYPPDANGESTRPMLDFNSPPGTCPFAKRSNSTRVKSPPLKVRGDWAGRSRRSRNPRRIPLLPTEPFGIILTRQAKSRYRQPPRTGYCECCRVKYERGTFYPAHVTVCLHTRKLLGVSPWRACPCQHDF